MVEFQRYMKARIDERRAQPREDMLTDLVNARVDDERPLDEAELLSVAQQMLVAANTTTSHMLSGGILTLIDNPDQYAKVCANADLIPNMVEELLRLRGAGIPVEVVPGISSSIAAAVSAWIPVSYRDLSPSFGVFAGHPGDGVRKVVDFEAAARVGTAVFLMGVARLEEIVTGLMEHGRDPHTPIALVERATLPDERVVTGTLATIQEVARDVRAPATIIVGEVVDVRHQALSQLLPVQAKTS